MNASSGQKSQREKVNQNIQVYLRVRPTNSREKLIKSQEIVEVVSNREIVLKPSSSFLDSRSKKKFTFDKAFDTNSKQHEVYQAVVAPYIEEVLAGYNCTVFAYGQTGTGKTYTMVGEEQPELSSSWEDDTQTGIIPRALNHLFDELRLTELEFTMRISYLELYNEELCDLLSTNDAAKIRIFDDVNKKGSVIIQGLEEIPVHSKDDVYKLLAKGQERRRTASTLMNDMSSRSHTIFSIIVHIKENGIDGEEMLKAGKLNLVDLAGSENITKAGNERGIRTRETVNINQSLLTLGRVITALVEKTPHIPYRESKLTRLLQESLGGRTKTSIIATVSPGHKDFEETLSTLEYAHRAKNIQNKPEANQKLSKKTVMKEYTEEIDKLRRDLAAARDKNGIYLAEDTYQDMLYKHDCQSRELNDKMVLCKALKEELARKEGLFQEVSLNLEEKLDVLVKTEKDLHVTKNELGITKKTLRKTKRRYTEKKVVLENHIRTEEALTHQAKELIHVVEKVATDTNGLHDTIERRKETDGRNKTVCEKFVGKIDASIQDMKSDVRTVMLTINQFSDTLIDGWDNYLEAQQAASETVIKKIQSFKALSNSMMDESVDICTKYGVDVGSWSAEQLLVLQAIIKDSNSTKDILKEEVGVIITSIEELMATQKLNLIEMCTKFIEHIETNTAANNRMSREQECHLRQMSALLVEFEKQQNSFKASIMTETLERESMQTEFKNFTDKMNAFLSSGWKRNEFHAAISAQSDAHQRKVHENVENNCSMVSEHLKDSNNSNRNMVGQIGDWQEQELEEFQENSTKLIGLNDCVSRNVDAISIHNQKTLDSLLDYEANLNSKLARLTEQIQEHKAKSLTMTADQCDIIVSDIVARKEAEHQFKHTNSAINKELQRKVEHYGNTTQEKLMMASNQVNKFQKDELQLYSPTGQTPVRKTFNYPKDIATTSPHERIVRRFWREKGMQDLDTSITILEDQEDSIAAEDSIVVDRQLKIRNSTPLHTKLQSSTMDEDSYLKDLQISNILSKIAIDEDDKENMSIIEEH